MANPDLGSIREEIQAAVQTQPDVFLDTPEISEGQIHLTNGVVSAPASGSKRITLDLPNSRMDKFDTPDRDDENYTALEVRDEGDGAFRALIHISSVDAPHFFEFTIDPRFEILPLEDGGLVVRDEDGRIAGTFDAPWAVDANGFNLPTEYVVDGNSFSQKVVTNEATAFPVVADPFWIPALMVTGHLTRHAAMRAASRGVSHALIKQVLRNGTRSAGRKGTTVFTQGKGKNRIRVVVDNRTGNIITVTKG